MHLQIKKKEKNPGGKKTNGKGLSHLCKGKVFISFGEGGGLSCDMEHLKEYGWVNED